MPFRPFDPKLDLPLAAWWDSTDTNNQIIDGSNVRGWTDKISGIALTPASSTSWPTPNANGIGFTSNQRLEGTYNAGQGGIPSGDNGGDLILIGTYSGATVEFFRFGTTDNTGYRALGSTSGGNLKTANSGANVIVSTTSLSPEKIFDWTVPTGSGTTQAWVDGTSAGTASKGTYSTGSGFIRLGITAVTGATLNVRHAFITSRQLTTDERQKLEGWKSWYATGQNGAELPASHPYKSAAPMTEVAGSGTTYTLLNNRGRFVPLGSSRPRVSVAFKNVRGRDEYKGRAFERVSVAFRGLRGVPGFRGYGGIVKTGSGFANLRGRIEQKGRVGRFGVQPVLHTPRGSLRLSGVISARFRATSAMRPLGSIGFRGTARFVTTAILSLKGPRGALGFRSRVGSIKLRYAFRGLRGPALSMRGRLSFRYAFAYNPRGRMVLGGGLGFGYAWSDLTAPGREPADIWLDTAPIGGNWQEAPTPKEV